MELTGPSRRNSLPPGARTQDRTDESSKAAEDFDKMVAMFKPAIEEQFFRQSHESTDFDFAPNIQPTSTNDDDGNKDALHPYLFSLGSVFLEQGETLQAYKIFCKTVNLFNCARSAEKLEIPGLREIASLPESAIEGSSYETSSFSASDDN